MYAHWPAIALDSAGTVYLVWDTDDRQAGTTGGCGGGPSAAPNRIMLAWSKDFGQTWSAPIAVAAPAGARVFWPWIAAGDAGKVSVVWYQTEPGEVADMDCQVAHVHAMEATILNATSGKRTVQTVDAVGRYVHDGSVCQGGTTCVATGQDRRLGDFFTNALDARGCVTIASGDTRLTDETGGQLPTARPIFIRQTAGPTLIGHGTCGPNDKGDGTYDESYVKGRRHAHHRTCSSRAHRTHRRHAKHRAHSSARKHKPHHRRSTCARRHQRHVKHHHRR